MTSATGKPSQDGHPPGSGRASPHRGFTLIEILLVLALIAVVAGLAVARFETLAAALSRKPIAVRFHESLREIRLSAREDKATLLLRWDEEARALNVEDTDGNIQSTQPFNEYPELESIAFYPAEPDPSLRGSVTLNYSREPIPSLRFEPNGASQRVRVEIETEDETIRYLLDPFSSTLKEAP